MFTCYLYEDIYHISEHTHGYTFQNIRISGRTATVLPLPRSDTSCIQLQIIIISIQECRTMWHLKISSSLAFQQEEHGQITTLQEIHVHSRQWRVPLILLQEHLQKPSLWKNSNPTILTEEYPVLDCKEDTGDTNWNHLHCCTSRLTTDTSSTTILLPGAPTDLSVSTVFLNWIYHTVLLTQESTRNHGEQSAITIKDNGWLGWETPLSLPLPLPPPSLVRVEARGTVEALTVEHDRNPVVCFMFIKHDFN